MPLSPGMAAGLTGPAVGLFYALEIDLPDATLRLLDGAGAVSISGQTFTGEDATFGVLAAIEAVGDGLEGEAPALRFILNPKSTAAAADLSSPTFQGSAVTLWEGSFDPATGAVLGTPYAVFIGELDVPTLQVDAGDRKLQFDCVSGFERFFEDDEGARLSNAFHQSVYPGETGLEFVTAVQQSLPWMADLPRPVMVRDVLK